MIIIIIVVILIVTNSYVIIKDNDNDNSDENNALSIKKKTGNPKRKICLNSHHDRFSRSSAQKHHIDIREIDD